MLADDDGTWLIAAEDEPSAVEFWHRECAESDDAPMVKLFDPRATVSVYDEDSGTSEARLAEEWASDGPRLIGSTIY
jgi:hypothetical protein